jgi:hypothetical protein
LKTPEYITFILEEGLQNPTKIITSHITKNILRILKNISPEQLSDSVKLNAVVNIEKVDPNLGVLKKQIHSKLKNPFLLNVQLEIHPKYGHDIYEASYNNVTNVLRLEIQIDKTNSSKVHPYDVVQLHSTIDHELRHWYQRNFWKDSGEFYKAFIETPGFHKVNNFFLSAFEIDSYVRGWVTVIQKLPTLNIPTEWTAFMVSMWIRVNKIVNQPDISLEIINNNVIPFYYKQLMSIQPVLGNEIKIDNITKVNINTYIEHAKKLEKLMNVKIKEKQLSRKYYIPAKKEGNNVK